MSMDTIVTPVLFVLSSVLLAANRKPLQSLLRQGSSALGLHEYRQHQELVLHHLALSPGAHTGCSQQLL